MNVLAQLTENQHAAGEAAGRLWWHWRHAFLAAKHQPNDAAALLATLDSDVLAMFNGCTGHAWQARAWSSPIMPTLNRTCSTR